MEAVLDILSRPVVVREHLRLFFSRDVWSPDNSLLMQVLTPRDADITPRVLVFWDGGLERPFPGLVTRIVDWFDTWQEGVRLEGSPVRVAGGEQVKNDFRQVEKIWAAIEAAKLCRHSYVLAIGGGAMLDTVGFAAATAHRGIPLVRLPTTSLSQADGGVGVKNGINYFGKKNWLGSFVVPHAVVNDAVFLHGLPARERRAGLAEAVKVALIRDAALFDFIEERVEALAAFEPEPFEFVIRESARHHVEHIATAGDPFERGSARPLDFGHWAAHKLEQMTRFAVSHGDAVAIGLALDVLYASRAGLLPTQTAERVIRVLSGLGFPLYHPALEMRRPMGRRVLLEGLDEFREHLGGKLTIPMIRAPGDRVDVHTIESAFVDAAVDALRSGARRGE